MPDITFRLLTPADLDLVMRLKTAAGWNQVPADVTRLLDLAPGGCVAALEDGVPAGTGSGIVYEAAPGCVRTGWVGMILVDPARRRRGIGSAVTRQVIRHLEGPRGCRAIRLDATPLGKTVYDGLGFRVEYALERRLRLPAASPSRDGPAPVAITAGDLADLAAFDLAAFRCDRGLLLRRLVADGPLFSALARDAAGGVAGYLLARAGSTADFLGPWAARDAGTAERLLAAAVAALGGRPLFVDVPQPNAAAPALAARFGFTVQRELTRMRLGEAAEQEDLGVIWGSAGPEWG
jgi:GNAT superfamily N-acetyltransferase